MTLSVKLPPGGAVLLRSLRTSHHQIFWWFGILFFSPFSLRVASTAPVADSVYVGESSSISPTIWLPNHETCMETGEKVICPTHGIFEALFCSTPSSHGRKEWFRHACRANNGRVHSAESALAKYCPHLSTCIPVHRWKFVTQQQR